jgi:hypothetical protein
MHLLLFYTFLYSSFLPFYDFPLCHSVFLLYLSLLFFSTFLCCSPLPFFDDPRYLTPLFFTIFLCSSFLSFSDVVSFSALYSYKLFFSIRHFFHILFCSSLATCLCCFSSFRRRELRCWARPAAPSSRCRGGRRDWRSSGTAACLRLCSAAEQLSTRKKQQNKIKYRPCTGISPITLLINIFFYIRDSQKTFRLHSAASK